MATKNKLTSEQVYNHSAIRTTAVIFGALFSNIHVRKYNKDGSISDKTSLVPISYQAKDQYALWLEQEMRTPQGNIEINVKLPRMSFEMTGLTRDEEKKSNPNLPMFTKTISANGKTLRSRSPIPYVFDYQLSIWCKQMDDSIQILDQILPMFVPELSIKLRESRKLNIYNDVKVVLNGVSKNDNYQSGFDENRMIVWDLSFQVHADIMPEPEESTVIQTVVVDTVEMVTDAYIDGVIPEYMNGTYGLKVRETFEPSRKTRQ
jgi:hypothetical protein